MNRAWKTAPAAPKNAALSSGSPASPSRQMAAALYIIHADEELLSQPSTMAKGDWQNTPVQCGDLLVGAPAEPTAEVAYAKGPRKAPCRQQPSRQTAHTCTCSPTGTDSGPESVARRSTVLQVIDAGSGPLPVQPGSCLRRRDLNPDTPLHALLTRVTANNCSCSDTPGRDRFSKMVSIDRLKHTSS